MSREKKQEELPNGGAVGRFRHFRLKRDESGSALVEFALSIGLMITLFFGIIEFGFALYSYQFVNETARDLTRYAIVRGSSCLSMPNCGFTDGSATLQSYARSGYRYPGLDSSKVTVTNTWYSPVLDSSGRAISWSACASGTGCNKPGYLIKITVNYPFVLNIPFVPQRTLGVSSSSSMVISQ